MKTRFIQICGGFLLFSNCFLGMAGASYKEPEGKNSCENLLMFGLLNPAMLPSAYIYKSLNNDMLCKIYMLTALSVGTGTGTSTTSSSRYRMFLTGTTYNGNLGGNSGADNFCNTDSARPDNTKTYKMLYFDRMRTVMKPFTSYYRSDNSTLIGTTDDQSFLPKPLVNSFSGDSTYFWYGDDILNCKFWTSSSFSNGWTPVGNSSALTNWWKSDTSTCDQKYSLLCVEQ